MSIYCLGAFEIPTQSTENVGAASAAGSKISGSADQLPVPAGSSIGKESKKHKKGKKKKKKRKKNKKNKNGNDGSGSSSSDSEAEVDVTSMVNFVFLKILYSHPWQSDLK